MFNPHYIYIYTFNQEHSHAFVFRDTCSQQRSEKLGNNFGNPSKQEPSKRAIHFSSRCLAFNIPGPVWRGRPQVDGSTPSSSTCSHIAVGTPTAPCGVRRHLLHSTNAPIHPRGEWTRAGREPSQGSLGGTKFLSHFWLIP